MPPSTSSFLDLKAQLAKQEAEFAKNKAAGETYIKGGVQRPDKVRTCQDFTYPQHLTINRW